MKILAKQNRELIMVNAQNTQNENDAEKIILKVPEQYEDFNKKIVFVTPDGNVWDIITNNEYLIKKAITKYEQVDFYIWLTKGDVDFRSQTKTLKFYQNVDASDEITDEEIGRVNTVVNLLEEEIAKVNNLESQIDGKLEEVDTAIDNIHTAIQETENLDLDAEKVGQTTTITLTKKDGTVKTVHVDDGVDLQFMWQGTSLGIKTAEQSEYTFVDLQGVQGQRGEQGEPFTIKKTYSSVAEMNADFNNMQLGDYVMIASTVEVEDNAKLYTRGENQWIFITDFSGATGIRGETGLTPNIQIGTVTQGTSFNVTRTGTNENPVLNFTLVKGDKGDRGIQGIQGLTGNGISSITKTSTSGLVDTYTITYTNGNTTTFTITNGEDGEVTKTELDTKLDTKANTSDVYNKTETDTRLNAKANSADVYIKNDFRNAGAHNSLYRGKDITSLFYDGTLSKQIAAGTFDDIFIGDYIIGKVSGRKYLVADLNYRLHTGETECTKNHVLMIPEGIMGTAKMNDSNITTGAYVESKMYTEYLTPFKTVINNDFGSGHILSHSQYLKKAVTNGYESSGEWKDSTIELMNELMVYGSNIFHNIQHGTNVPQNYTIDKSQLSLFRLDKSKIVTRNSWWLRDVVSASNFAFVTSDGLAHGNGASNSYGVRPAFLIY